MALVEKGQVMSGNHVVALINNDEVTVIDDKRCPYFLQSHNNLIAWLEDRVFDTTRGHSRTLRRIADLTKKTDAEIALRFWGATVTDNYWIRTEENSDSHYDDVRFKTDQLFLLALKGDSSDLDHKPEEIDSPQFTVPGCLEKGWKIEEQKWVLYKRVNTTEQFNEMFVSDVSNAIGVESVVYCPTVSGVKSENFAEDYNFEDMNGIIADNYADYEFVYDAVKARFGDKAALDYVMLIYIDAVCCNVDRHSKNFGVLRNRETGKFISLAPNYDYNQSLFGNDIDVSPKSNAQEDLFITDFCNLILKKNINVELPELSEERLRESTQREESYDLYEDAVRFVMQRQKIIKEKLISVGFSNFK